MNRKTGNGFVSWCLMGILWGPMSAGSLRATAAEHRPELVMVALSGHLIGSGYCPERFSPDHVRAWVAACDEMGVTRILWRGAYVGKATYHSKVLPVTLKGWHGYGGPAGAKLGISLTDDASELGKPCYRFDLDWETWIREGIADALMVYSPMPDAVGRVQRTIKSRLTKGDVFLWRKIWQDKQFDAYHDEIAAIRGGAIDGYAVEELNQFLPHLSSSDWRKSRELLEGLR